MFVALLSERSAEAQPRLEAAARKAAAAGLDLISHGTGARLFAGGAQRPAVRVLGAGWVVGELFQRAPGMADAPHSLPGGRNPPERIGRELLERCWGGYVGLLRAPEASGWEVLRDPSGAREALVWEDDGVWSVSDTLDLPAALRPPVCIDWAGVAGLLVHPATITGDLALNGVSALAPGELRALSSRRMVRRWLWSPAQAALREPSDAFRARTLVREVVAASTRSRSRPLAEVSGGFDSSVVASALVAARGSGGVTWIHHVVEEAEADERDFARATAARLALAVVERIKPEAALEPSALMTLPLMARPSLNATDTEYERAMVEAAASAGCDGFITGQGGDAVFLTLRSAWLGADRLQRRGMGALFDPAMLDMARWSRASVWTLLRRALLHHVGLAHPERRGPNPFVSRAARRLSRACSDHPWLREVGALAPAKQAQVQGLAEALIVQGACLRTGAAPLIHPLLTQPVLELGLAIPADILLHGGRDRAWAREVFAQDLAPEVARRRSKGDLTAYYGRMVAAGLPRLTPFLLDGCLAERGLLDRERLRGGLDPERLGVDGLYADLMDLVAIEAWARAWSG